MGTVGATADVTVTYNSNKAGAEDIEKTVTVTCIDAEATVGTKLYAVSDDTNDLSNCAKFYISGTAKTTPVSVAEGGEEDDLYFCAVDDNGNVIDYDQYDVDSSNDDVASADATKDTGKFAHITVTGNTIGSANVVVVATKNGAATTYTIPVNVVKKGILDHITVTADKPTITNAIDDDYFGTLTVKAYDVTGTELKAADGILKTYELVDETNKKGKIVDGLEVFTGADGTTRATGFVLGEDIGEDENTYYAWGAKESSQSIKVTVSQNDVKKEKTVPIKVDALAKTAWNITDNEDEKGANITYQIELDKTSIDEKNLNDEDKGTATARLKATIGSKFAGYVRQDAQGHVTIGTGYTGTEDIGAKASVANQGGLKFVAVANGENANGYKFTTKPAVAGTYEVKFNGTGGATAADMTIDGKTVNITDGMTAAQCATAWSQVPGGTTNFGIAVKTGATDTIVLTQKVPGTGTLTTVTTANGMAATVTPGVTAVEAGVTYEANPAYEAGSALSNTNFIGTITYVYPSTVTTLAAAKTDYDTEAAGVTKAELFTVDVTAGSGTVAAVIGTNITTGGVDNVTVGKSSIKLSADSFITDIKPGVKYGVKYSKDGELYDSAENVKYSKDQLTALAGESIVIDPVNDGTDGFYVKGDTDKDGYFAKPGSYTVEFNYIDAKAKEQKASQGLTVKNTIYIPEVEVTSRVVDSLDASDIVTVLKASVDMNNDDSDYASIDDTDVWSAVDKDGVGTPADVKDTKVTVKYVGVVEEGIYFFVPINTTFRTE